MSPTVTVTARSSAALSPVSPRKRVVAIKAAAAEGVDGAPSDDVVSEAEGEVAPKTVRKSRAKTVAAEGVEGGAAAPASPAKRAPRKPKAVPEGESA